MCTKSHEDDVLSLLSYLITHKELSDSPIVSFIKTLRTHHKSTSHDPNRSLTETLASLSASLSSEQEEISNSKRTLLKTRQNLISELSRVEAQLAKDEERQHRVTHLQEICQLALDFSLSSEEIFKTREHHITIDCEEEDQNLEIPESVDGQCTKCNTDDSVGNILCRVIQQDVTNESMMCQLLNAFEVQLLDNSSWCVNTEGSDALASLFQQLPRYPLSVQLVAFRSLLKIFTVSPLQVDEVTLTQKWTQLISTGSCIETLVSMLSSINEEVKCCTFDFLLSFISIPHLYELVRCRFTDCNGLHAVINIMITSSSESVLEKALGFLGKILSDNMIYYRDSVVCDELRDEIVSLGGLQVIDLLYTDTISILESASFVIDDVSRSDKAKDALREMGYCEKIVASLLHPLHSIVGKMTSVVWNLSTSCENRRVFRGLGVIPTLLGLLNSINDVVCVNATGALRNFSIDSEGKLHVIAYGGVETLLLLAQSTQSETVLENVLSALLNTSAAAESRPLIRNAHGIPLLLSILSSTSQSSACSLKLMDSAAGVLRNCAIDDRNKLAIKECGGISVLVSVLRDRSSAFHSALMDKVASTLWILTISTEIKCAMIQNDSVETVVNLLLHSCTMGREDVGEAKNFLHLFPKEGNAVCVTADTTCLINSFPSQAPSLSIPMNIREKLAGIVRNCCAVQQFRLKMLKCGAALALTGCLWDCFSTHSSFCSTSSNASRRKAMSAIGRPSPQLCETISSALWHLSRADKCIPRQQGAIDALCFLVSLPDLSANAFEEAAGAISSLAAGSRENSEWILQRNGICMLLKYIQRHILSSDCQDDEPSASDATKKSTLLNVLLALRNSTTSSEHVLSYVVKFSMENNFAFCLSLLDVIKNESEECACEAIFIIKNLSTSIDIRNFFAPTNINLHLATLLKSAKSLSLRSASASALKSLRDC